MLDKNLNSREGFYHMHDACLETDDLFHSLILSLLIILEEILKWRS